MNEELSNERNSNSVLDSFLVSGLDEHNRSVRWIEETAKKIGATITTASDSRWSRYSDCFDIQLCGRDSGILYKITVSQSNKQTKFLSKRFGEFELDENNAPVIMNAFPEIMSCDVKWYDLRTSDWSYICMRDVQNKSKPHWPGDGIVSVMYALNDDLRSCLEEEMRTLRREMIVALVTYWFAKQTPDDYPHQYSIDDVCKYVFGLTQLEEMNSEKFKERALELKNLEIFRIAKEREDLVWRDMN